MSPTARAWQARIRPLRPIGRRQRVLDVHRDASPRPGASCTDRRSPIGTRTGSSTPASSAASSTVRSAGASADLPARWNRTLAISASGDRAGRGRLVRRRRRPHRGHRSPGGDTNASCRTSASGTPELVDEQPPHRGHHRLGPTQAGSARGSAPGRSSRSSRARSGRAAPSHARVGIAGQRDPHVEVRKPRLEVVELVAKHDVATAPGPRTPGRSRPASTRSVRLRTIDIIGVIPTPPAISTHALGLVVPANTKRPAGAETLSTLPSRQRVVQVTRRRSRRPPASPRSRSSRSRVGDDAIVYERLTRLPSIVSARFRYWPATWSNGSGPPSGATRRNVLTSGVSSKIRATSSSPDQNVRLRGGASARDRASLSCAARELRAQIDVVRDHPVDEQRADHAREHERLPHVRLDEQVVVHDRRRSRSDRPGDAAASSAWRRAG